MHERELIMKNVKAFFSKAGQAFMLPIALLPAAGILLGIGKSFTNPAFLESYPNLTFMQEGTVIYNILEVMGVAGDIVFANLPLLFAVGLAVGFAKKEKGGAALASIIGYLVMLVVSAQVLNIIGYDANIFNLGFLDNGLDVQTVSYLQNLISSTWHIDAGFFDMDQIANLATMDPMETINIFTSNTDNVAQVTKEILASDLITALGDKQLLDGQITLLHQPGALTNTLNIVNTLSMGVFGGILSGGLTVFLHNKFIDAKLPDVLGFFGGPRLIPILAAVSGIVLGAAMAYVWPIIGTGLSMLGQQILLLGSFGSFLFGLIERTLIPFGLHHVFYTPLWQTSVGGVAEVGGELFFGTQNIFFANLANGSLADMSSTNFMSGKFPFMMFGLPGAALAMYSVALTKNKKIIGGMLLSVAITSMLTGITEPLEFTFLFLAPVLYFGVHVPLAAISFFLMDILQVKIGMTFSGGLIDYTMFGLLPQGTGQDVNAIMVLIVGVIYFFLYFFIFRFLIRKLNIMTPGRGEDLTLKTKADFKSKKKAKGDEISPIGLGIIEALGGKDNIKDIDACITRLRVTVLDSNLVKPNEFWVNELSAKGLVVSGNGIQAIYGSEAQVYKSELSPYLGLE